MMKLSDEHEKVLRNIAANGNDAMLKADIDLLIKLSLITKKFGGGWMLNSKGREYLKQHKKS